MKTDETMKLLADKEFLDKLYGYAYRRCATMHEAEDLCSDILVAVVKAIRKSGQIENFYAFVWTIAHRTYADYCEKRKVRSDTVSSAEYSDAVLAEQANPIEELLEKEEETEKLRQIMREISFLAKIYRDVMVMYYLDEMKISAIAKRLGISENLVKQRLFSARNTVKREVEKMEERKLTLKPVYFDYVGTGKPVGNEPFVKAERALSRNLVYLCKEKPKSVGELSEALSMPMPYIEEELEIQCRGENGRYGLLRKLENGKYISNVIIVDEQEYREAGQVYERHFPEYCRIFKKIIEQNREKILSFPFLSKQTDCGFILWALVGRMTNKLCEQVSEKLKQKYFQDIKVPEREYTCVVVAGKEQKLQNSGFYGCDGISAEKLCGYAAVLATNVYGSRIEAHFHCGHSLYTDTTFQMILKAIGGLSVESLSEAEKESAAKAIECGYLRKNGSVLEPKVLVIGEHDSKDFYALLSGFEGEQEMLADKIAADVAAFIKKHLPQHLMEEYQFYNGLIASIHTLHDVIEECIREGLLSVPQSRLCAEGVVVEVWE